MSVEMSNDVCLSVDEALRASDAFLKTIYGPETYARWRNLKTRLRFQVEREFVDWILDWMENADVEGGDDEGHEEKVGGGEMGAAKYHQQEEGDGLYQQTTEIDLTGMKDESSVVDECDVYDDGSYEALQMQQECHTISGEDLSSSLPDVDGAGGVSSRVMPCHHCNTTFRYRSALLTHIKQVHEREKNVACEFCEFRAFNQFNLRDHMINRHGVRSEFRCEDCGKYWITAKKLARHEDKCAVRVKRMCDVVEAQSGTQIVGNVSEMKGGGIGQRRRGSVGEMAVENVGNMGQLRELELNALGLNNCEQSFHIK